MNVRGDIMRRSDVIDIMITTALFSEAPTRADRMEELLTAIERVGMLPPSTNYIIEYNSKDMLRGLQEFKRSHRWEKEDENTNTIP